MDSQHRKIELQSPADLTYLTSLLRAAALQKLNLHLPPVSSTTNDATNEPDELRHTVEQLVDTFVAQVLQGMRQNISINGLDVIDSPDNDDAAASSVVEQEVFEPFDDKLRSQLGAAVARRDELVKKISAHRRATPSTATSAFQQRWQQEATHMGEAADALLHQATGVQGDLQLGGLQRQEDVMRNWERAVGGLLSLNKGLPETRARLERAGEVVGYLEEQRQAKGR